MESPRPEPGRDSSSLRPRTSAAARARGSRPGPSSSIADDEKAAAGGVQVGIALGADD